MSKSAHLKNFFFASSLIVASLSINAATPIEYQEEVFKSEQAKGSRIVLDFHQKGCGTCKKQAEVIQELSKEKGYEDVTFLRVNFDDDKLLNKKFKVSSKSTLVVLNGQDEVARAIGITSKEDISKLINSEVRK